MKLKLKCVQLGSKRTRGEGLRIGAVRFLPRGVRKQDYARLDYFDVWLPSLAPSRELLARFRKGTITSTILFRQYEREMRQTEARQTIELLAKLAQRTPISVGCYCEDPAQCHRSVLDKLIRQA